MILGGAPTNRRKRVLALVKSFLKSGILGEDGQLRDNDTGTPQGSILSPLLSNVALSVLDEFLAQEPGGPTPGGRAGEASTSRPAESPADQIRRFMPNSA